LGSLRSTAQLISYELVLSSGILVVIMLAGSLNITAIIESQRPIWYIIPLFPLFLIILIGSVAETNRAPFDLAEAESELVSGFMTEHSAVIFVFFFLAEYASIVLMCMLKTILFLGGYLYLNVLTYLINLYYNVYNFILACCLSVIHYYNVFTSFSALPFLETKVIELNDINIIEKLFYSFSFGIKICIMIFIFI
jgi:NADH-ubiquinone oxidoreductase chain 1